MKFMLILVAGIIILAGGFFAGSCYIRGNSPPPPPEPPFQGNACLAAVAEANPDPEVLALIGKGFSSSRLTRLEEISIRETLRRMELPACDHLLRRVTQATPTPAATRTP